MRIYFEIEGVDVDALGIDVADQIVDFPIVPRVGDTLRVPFWESRLIVKSVYLVSTNKTASTANDAVIRCSIDPEQDETPTTQEIL